MPGSWVPGGFPPWVTLAAKLTLFGDGAIRGVDYFAGDSESTARRLSAIESAAPLWLWGLILLVGGILGFVSIILRLGRGVMIAHIIGLAVYAALGVGIISDVIQRTEAGWSSLVLPLVALVVGGAAVLVACRWSRWEHAELTTAGVAIAAAFAVASIDLDGLRSATILLAVGMIHGLMSLGTASQLRQSKLIREGAV